MEIGKLNRRVTYTTYAAGTTTATGGYTKGAATDKETWAHVKPLSQRESLLNGLQLGQRALEFTFRYEQGDNITQQVDLTYDNRIFKVRSIIEVDENRKIVKVIGSERTD